MARVLSVHDEDFQLLRLLSEKMSEETHESVVVYEGRRVNGGPIVILKLRYQYAYCLSFYSPVDANIYPVEGSLLRQTCR